MLWLLLTVVFISSLLLTWCIKYAAMRLNMMDVPNDRSSHSVVTPRGGGLSFILIFFIGLIWFASSIDVWKPSLFSIVLPGFIIALIGFLDDLGHIPARYRLMGHLAVGILTLAILHGAPSVHVFAWDIPPSIILNMIFVLYIAWMINLYNFMDGIDGLAGMEAISVCFSMAFIYSSLSQFNLLVLPLLLGAAVLGFICWNFPIAKIFMGDAGSGFLGFVLSTMSILSIGHDSTFFFSWLILLGVFLVDSSYTLLFRLWRGDKIYQAHKSHAYQQAALKYSSHQCVTFAVLCINMFWLFPIAYLVAWRYLDELLGLAIAYTPLIYLVIKLKAGEKSLVIN